MPRTRHNAASAAVSTGLWRSPSPRSIAMLVPCPFPTHQGTQVFIRHLACALRGAGHEVHLVTYGTREYEEDYPFVVHRASAIARSLRSGPTFAKPAADATLLYTAARVIRAYGCDLIHAHNVEGLGVGALLKLQTGKPLVYHAHNAMGPELPTYFRAHLVQAFASMLGDVLDRTLPKAADAVITFDPDHRAMHEVYGVEPERLHVIPPGLMGEEIRRADARRVKFLSQELGPGPWLLYAGNPDRYQNLPLLWEAFKIVRKSCSEVRLLVASSHPPGVFDEELEHAGLLQEHSGVTVHQFSTIDELRALFALADVGMSPRTLWAGAPIKILNYLAAGLPVVACRSGARHLLPSSPHMLTDATPDDFARAIVELLSRSKKDRPRARRSFDKFRLENQLPLYEKVYERVLSSRLPS